MKKRYLIIIALIIFIIWMIWGNISIKTSIVDVKINDLPQSFAGYKIVQISDLHNATFDRGNYKLVNRIKNSTPDIVVITGDIIDANHTDVDVAIDFIEKIKDVAPIYFVTGNHEAWVGDAVYQELETALINYGVIVLKDETVKIEKDNEFIVLAGLDDPEFSNDAITDRLKKLDLKKQDTTILLSHRPELFYDYVKADIDLVLSGHAHGGQFRLPFVGGLVAPNQGIFPKYDAGLFVKNSTNMYVSRGLGNSIIPIRFNNRSEVVIIKLDNI